MRLGLGPGRETEGDFVLAVPDRGLLVLEVKGGRIEVRDGRFYQNNREMDEAPRQQGHTFVKALADLYLGRSVDESLIRQAMTDGLLRITTCPSRSSVADKAALEVDKLLGERLSPGDVAVLSVRGGTHAESIIHAGRLGRHALLKATDAGIDGSVVGDTFLRFKGLERPAIVITDLHLLADEPRDVRMHIALTRALSAVRIVAAQEDLVRDPVLAKFASR